MPSYSGVEARVASPSFQVSHTHIGHTVCAENDLSGRKVGGHSHTECKSRAQGSRASCLQLLHFPLYVTAWEKEKHHIKMLGVTFSITGFPPSLSYLRDSVISRSERSLPNIWPCFMSTW